MKRWLPVPLALAVVLIMALPASADMVTRSGPCSLGHSVKTVEFKNDFGPTLEVSAFVDSPVAGQKWHVNIRHNGVLFLSENVVTNSHGNFEIDAHHAAKHLLPDALTFKAFNLATSEVCRAQATLK